MRRLFVFALLLLCGCHQRIRLGSPQFQRAPAITCIVLVETDKLDEKLAEAAINACRNAVETQTDAEKMVK